MPINSKKKGKRGELEIARLLREYGVDARRGVQYSGANGDPDVVGLQGAHIEVKRTERLNIDTAMQQSIEDAREGEMPLVMHRRNRQPWLVTMTLDDFMNLWRRNDEG